MIMTQHDPEPAQQGSGDLYAKLRHITLQKSADVIFQPLGFVFFIGSQKRARETPTSLCNVFVDRVSA